MKKGYKITRGRYKGATVSRFFIDPGLKQKDLENPRTYNVYVIYIRLNERTIVYVGNGIEFENKDGKLSLFTRALNHKNDMVESMILKAGAENATFEIYSGFTKDEAEGFESALIFMERGTKMECGQKTWNGEKFLNKRTEDLAKAKRFFDLHGNNYLKTIARQINSNKR